MSMWSSGLATRKLTDVDMCQLKITEASILEREVDSRLTTIICFQHRQLAAVVLLSWSCASSS